MLLLLTRYQIYGRKKGDKVNFFEKEIEQKLSNLKKEQLYREINYIDSASDRYVDTMGKKLLMLSSNNYLGLCNDNRLKDAAIKSIGTFGCGSSGSRLTTGSYRLYDDLERSLAEFKGYESALVYNTGYMANIGVISAIADSEWVIFSDELNHASIIDGCKMSKAKIIIYKHLDTVDLEEKVKLYSGEKNIIITDGVFSMEGDIAPLKEITEIAQKYENILVMVDDAHGTGVLGERGSGVVEFLGLEGKVDIQIGTLSKALGSEGGFVVGSNRLIEYLKNKSRTFIYTTALSPSSVAVSLEALDIISKQKLERRELLEKTYWFKDVLKNYGFNISDSSTPIIPIIVEQNTKAIEFSKGLLREGLYVQAIRPPTVKVSRIRVTIMATHTMDDLVFALKKIYKVGKQIGII